MVTTAARCDLLANFRTVFFREIFVAERAMEIHTGTEHMRVYDENFFTTRTSDFNGLTHDYLYLFGFSLLALLERYLVRVNTLPFTPSRSCGPLEYAAALHPARTLPI